MSTIYTSANGRRKKVLFFIGALFCFMILVAVSLVRYHDSPVPTKTVNTSIGQGTITPEILSTGSPVRIIIPKINVDAVLEYVGLTPEGEMEEPTIAHNAAWYNRLPLPGDVGTSVIAGHFGFKDNKPAVFDNLHKLHIGDEIYIKDTRGRDIAFVVQALKDYDPEQDAAEVFNSSDGKSRLNLITCKGAWNETLKSYDTRLVIFAEKVAS